MQVYLYVTAHRTSGGINLWLHPMTEVVLYWQKIDFIQALHKLLCTNIDVALDFVLTMNNHQTSIKANDVEGIWCIVLIASVKFFFNV